MGMGAYTKGNNSSNRRRPYAMMLIVAFGFAVFGVMVLHKLRERRIFNLLVKEKDTELISLHLLLQKERDHTKELKGKAEEMKAKIYSLRTQNMQLGSRILEMHSTISSLQDEQRTMDSALEEKRNEIKMLREKETDLSKDDHQITSLTEILKQKEAEIEELKHRVEYPVKVWSVSTDDPSSPPVNLTEIATEAKNSKTGESEKIEESRQQQNESAETIPRNSTGGEGRNGNESSDKEGENSERVKNGNTDDREGTDSREMTEEKLQKTEHSQENGFPDKGESEQIVGEEKGKKNREEFRSGGNMEVGKENLKESRENEGQEIGTTSNGGMKAKMGENFQNSANLRARGRHGYLRSTRGKRWKMLAKKRGMEHKGDFVIAGAADMRSRRFSMESSSSSKKPIQEEDGKFDFSEKFSQSESLRIGENDQDVLDGRENKAVLDEGKAESKVKEEGDVRKRMEDKLLKPENLVDGKYQRTDQGNEHQLISIGETQKQKLNNELKQGTEQAGSGGRQYTNSNETEKVEDNSAQAKVAEEDENPEDNNPRTNTANDDIFWRYSLDSGDEKEYKKETDEPQLD